MFNDLISMYLLGIIFREDTFSWKFNFLLMPVGSRVWSLHIHCSLRSSWDLIPDWRIQTFSPFSWSLWKCSASSQLSGRFFISDRCFPNRFSIDLPVCPTYRRSCFLQRAAYTTFSVLQLPPSFSLIVMFFLVLVILGVFRMSLQSMQEPHSDVDVGFFVGGLMSFLTRIFRIVLDRRNATVGGSINISLNRSSALRTGKCCLRMDGTRLRDGCQSQTNIVCTSFFIFLVVLQKIHSVHFFDFFACCDGFEASKPRSRKKKEKNLAGMVIIC